MQALQAVRTIIKKGGNTLESAALKCGRTGSYFSVMFSRQSIPRLDIMAEICDSLGWDLLVRDRSDGYEEKIDPPVK